jgi:hypothetical protein
MTTLSARLDTLLSIVGTGVLPLNEWIGAGATCLGFGSALVSRTHTASEGSADPADLTPAVARLIALVAAARAGGSSRVPVPVKESRS